jgi:hypothetical protein
MTEGDMLMIWMMIVAAKTAGRGRVEGRALTKLANARDSSEYYIKKIKFLVARRTVHRFPVAARSKA